MDRSPWVPLALLSAFGLAFAWAALGGGLLIFDDHPGQLFRLWHGLRRSLLPWEWNPEWWAGYPELQFYPPGYVLLGALIHLVTFRSLAPETLYQFILWITYLAPGLATFWLMARVCRNPWLALPTALAALTMSAGSRSGVEGGVRTGMIAARLGLALLPLLALALSRWQERGGRPPSWTAPLLAGLLLTHPAHAPAAVLLILLAGAFGPPGDSARRRLAGAAWILALGAALTGFWTIPLLGRIGHALPLAWGHFSWGELGLELTRRPLLGVAGLGSALALGLASGSHRLARPARTLAALPWAVLAAVATNALVVEPLGIRWLPSDRLLDSLYLALLLGAGVAIDWVASASWRVRGLALCLPSLAFALLPGAPGEPDLTLWPRPGQWPKAEETIRALAMDRLWEEIRRAPPGRILFVRSGVPLTSGTEWYRPHTHLTALTPVFTRREILNGTFTHPSPVAGLIYTGSGERGAIRQLAETLDGQRLFGWPIERLTPEVFDLFSERLRVSAVVALRDDLGRLPFVEENPAFGPRLRVGPFVLFSRIAPRPLPEPVGPRRLRLSFQESPGGWAPAGLFFYPLWHAEGPHGPLPSRRDNWGLMEVDLPPGKHLRVDLVYREGVWEWLGLAVTATAALLWTTIGLGGLMGRKGRAQAAPAPSPWHP